MCHTCSDDDLLFKKRTLYTKNGNWRCLIVTWTNIQKCWLHLGDEADLIGRRGELFQPFEARFINHFIHEVLRVWGRSGDDLTLLYSRMTPKITKGQKSKHQRNSKFAATAKKEMYRAIVHYGHAPIAIHGEKQHELDETWHNYRNAAPYDAPQHKHANVPQRSHVSRKYFTKPTVCSAIIVTVISYV